MILSHNFAAGHKKQRTPPLTQRHCPTSMQSININVVVNFYHMPQNISQHYPDSIAIIVTFKDDLLIGHISQFFFVCDAIIASYETPIQRTWSYLSLIASP